MLFKKPVECCHQYGNLRNSYADNQGGRLDATRHIFKSKPQACAKHRELQNKNMESNDRHEGIGLLLALVLNNRADAPPRIKKKLIPARDPTIRPLAAPLSPSTKATAIRARAMRIDKKKLFLGYLRPLLSFRRGFSIMTHITFFPACYHLQPWFPVRTL
jgi:hypothetical protein